MDATWMDPDRHSGDECFAGTRVPVRTLWECLRAGEPLERFLEAFPSVERWQAEVVIRSRTIGEHMRDGTIDGLIAAGFWRAVAQHLEAGDVPLVLWDETAGEIVEVGPSDVLRERGVTDPQAWLAAGPAPRARRRIPGLRRNPYRFSRCVKAS
jgi:uncharacterized protein (DUF433 family)